MITDPLFYQIFETVPETFFELIGMSQEEAREIASKYQFQAIEFKETSHRSDGVFMPKVSGERVYFLEVQYRRSRAVFANLMVKVFTRVESGGG